MSRARATVFGPATLQGIVITPTSIDPTPSPIISGEDSSWQEAETVVQTVHIQSQALTAQQSGRQTHFGTTSDTGTAADTFDADHDGLANLIESAFGLSPMAGCSEQLPVP